MVAVRLLVYETFTRGNMRGIKRVESLPKVRKKLMRPDCNSFKNCYIKDCIDLLEMHNESAMEAEITIS